MYSGMQLVQKLIKLKCIWIDGDVNMFGMVRASEAFWFV